MVALVAAVCTLGLLWRAHRPVPLREVTRADVEAEADRGGYRLASAAQLWEHQQRDPDSSLWIDTRQEWEYRTGHIAGALSFPMEPAWWARLTKRAELAELLGPDLDRHLVFY